jgi:hypothetical protein
MRTASKKLVKEIKNLEISIKNKQALLEKLLKLKELTEDGDFLVLPEGFVMAKVVGWDVSSSEYEDYIPSETTYVVVPQEMGNEVEGFISSEGVELTGNGWTIPSPDYVGDEIEEEAILDFIRRGGENNPPNPYKKG